MVKCIGPNLEIFYNKFYNISKYLVVKIKTENEVHLQNKICWFAKFQLIYNGKAYSSKDFFGDNSIFIHGYL